VRPRIGIADYVVAIGRLDIADPELRRRVAELLGVDARQLVLPVREMTPGTESATGIPEPPSAQDSASIKVQPTISAPPRFREIPLDLDALGSGAEHGIGWPTDLPDPPESNHTTGPRVPAPPLVSPMLERGIVQLLLATERSSGDLDLHAVLDACARLEVADPLPELIEWTTLGGTDVLVDVSTAMAPFEDDVDRLIQASEHVGGESTRIFYFEQCPGRGVFSDEGPDEFRPERRTVVVGSFGCAPSVRSAGPEEWRHAILALRRRVPVVGVCPFAAARSAFVGLVPMVTWSEATTTTSVARVIREG
jgi:hypothetical protein